MDNMSIDWLIYWHMDKTLADLSVNLGRNLEQLRKKRGMSQGQLARSAGLPRSTLTYIESGEGNPSLQTEKGQVVLSSRSGRTPEGWAQLQEEANVGLSFSRVNESLLPSRNVRELRRLPYSDSICFLG